MAKFKKLNLKKGINSRKEEGVYITRFSRPSVKQKEEKTRWTRKRIYFGNAASDTDQNEKGRNKHVGERRIDSSFAIKKRT